MELLLDRRMMWESSTITRLPESADRSLRVAPGVVLFLNDEDVVALVRLRRLVEVPGFVWRDCEETAGTCVRLGDVFKRDLS